MQVSGARAGAKLEKKSNGNYVLFKQPNDLTNQFGSRFTHGYYRMALADYDTFTNWSTSHHASVT